MTQPGDSDILRAPVRLVRVSRELDAIRCSLLHAARGVRSDLVTDLYEVEGMVWRVLDKMDPTVRQIGWKAYLEQEEALGR